jgi:hypothetical protein
VGASPTIALATYGASVGVGAARPLGDGYDRPDGGAGDRSALVSARSATRLRTDFVCGPAGNAREDVEREYASESVNDRRCGVGRVGVEVNDPVR